MNPVLHTVVEGDPWPKSILHGAERSLASLDAQVLTRLGTRLMSWTPSGRRSVGYGVAGLVQVGVHQLRILPKAFSISDSSEAWSKSVPAFLRLSRELSAQDVFVTGRGAFAPSNALLPWWAEYYAAVLWRALHTTPYLRYEPFFGSLPYIRGKVVWDRSLVNVELGEPRLICTFRRYQAENALNQLLKWAAVKFMHLHAGARERLAACTDALANIRESAPERRAVERIRISPSMRVYEEPFRIARALYLSLYPSLDPGGVPAAAFLINMPGAFERFVDGLVHRAVTLARRHGHHWRAQYQQQHQLAQPVPPEKTRYYTRPDDSVWEVMPHLSTQRGVLVDAKYKGSARSPERYRKPVGADLYQIVASCIARGWRAGVIVAPALDGKDAGAVQRWTIRVQAKDEIHVAVLRLDLSRLKSTAEALAAAQAMQKVIEGSMSLAA